MSGRNIKAQRQAKQALRSPLPQRDNEHQQRMDAAFEQLARERAEQQGQQR